jgi:putative transposase
MIDFKDHRFEQDIILTCGRWYLAYPFSYRNLEEMMTERGVTIDHANIYRWIRKFTPKLEGSIPENKQAPGRHELEDGRDVHQNQREMEILVSRCR